MSLIKKLGQKLKKRKDPKPPERVTYIFEHNGNSYPVECWEGDSFGVVWNEMKSWYLPGTAVTITDNHGNTKNYIRGMI